MQFGKAERDAKEAPSTPMTTAASNGSGVPSKILIYKAIVPFPVPRKDPEFALRL
jgi:hypothetical protein